VFSEDFWVLRQEYFSKSGLWNVWKAQYTMILKKNPKNILIFIQGGEDPWDALSL